MKRVLRVLGAIFLLATSVVAVGATSSEAGTCDRAPTTGNWAIEGVPDVSVTQAHGVQFLSAPHTKNLQSDGLHVESIYLFNSLFDMVEYGWVAYPSNLYIFDSSLEGGTYHGPRLEQTATQYHNYTFRIVFNDSTHKFDLRLDGSDTGFHRDWGSLWWSSGRPTSVQELLYQCDGGSSENYDLWRQHPNGDWDKWNYTGWNCDMEDYYGYKAVSANDFEVYKPNDAYAPQRSSGCNPWAAPH